MPVKASKTLLETVDLVQFFQRSAPKNVLDRFERSRDRAMSLFGILATSETFLSDADVQRRTRMTPGAYQRAIWKLKSALLEAMLELDLKKGKYSLFSQRLKALDLANARVQILERLGAALAADLEARKWHKEALVLEKWDVALALLGPILNWAALSGDTKAYERWQQERRRLRTLQQAFEEAEEANERVTIVFAKSGAEHPELRPTIDKAIRRLKPVITKHASFRLRDAELNLRKKAQQVLTRYPEALEICDETSALLDQYPVFDNPARRSRNALTRLLCEVLLRQYHEASATLQTASKYFDIGTQNWYTFEEWHFMLLLHSRQDEAAYQLVTEIMSGPRFRVQSLTTQERWRLFLMYAEFFTGRVVPSKNLIRIIPSFSKDYAGYRASVVILEILLLLQLDDKSALIERIELLKTYKTRHLRKTAPTRLFINMCQLMVRYDFEKTRIAPLAERYLSAIVESDEGDPIVEAQVQHYDQLWGHFMAALPDEGKLFCGRGEDEKSGRSKPSRISKTVPERVRMPKNYSKKSVPVLDFDL